jgi:hypothetical protein
MAIKGRNPHILTAAIRELWADHVIEEKLANPPQIHAQMITRFGERAISLRTVQSVVRSLERHQSDIGPDDSEWSPWTGSETPEEIALLMELDLESRVWIDRPLKQIESKWAVRIAPSVAGLSQFTRWTLARQYAHREKIATLLGEEHIPVDFLNMLLAIKPWQNGKHELWATAVEAGLSEWQQQVFYDIAPFDTRRELIEPVYRDLNLNVEERSARQPLDEDWTQAELRSRLEADPDEEESTMVPFNPEGDLRDEVDHESNIELGPGFVEESELDDQHEHEIESELERASSDKLKPEGAAPDEGEDSTEDAELRVMRWLEENRPD